MQAQGFLARFSAAWRQETHYENFRKGIQRGVPASEVEGKNLPGRDGKWWLHGELAAGSVLPEVKHKAGSVRSIWRLGGFVVPSLWVMSLNLLSGNKVLYRFHYSK